MTPFAVRVLQTSDVSMVQVNLLYKLILYMLWFFDCHLANFVRQAVYYTFGINPPDNIGHLLGSWLNGYPAKLKKQLLVGASAMCWAIWLYRNDVVFHRTNSNPYLKVILRGIHRVRSWSQLSEEEAMKAIKNNCQRLEATTMKFFTRCGWNFKRSKLSKVSFMRCISSDQLSFFGVCFLAMLWQHACCVAACRL